MNPFEVTSASPVGSYYTFIAYKWVDTNHDGFAQKNEVLTNLGPQYSNAIDPAHPTSATSPNTIDPNYHSNRDNEFIVGVDHELMPNFAIGAAYTYRRTNDYPTWNARIGMTSADYAVVARPTNGTRSAVVYAPNGAKIDATGGGRILENRPDYHSAYQGLEVTLNKRLSNRWMSRVAFSYNDWTEHIDGPSGQNLTIVTTTSGSFGAGTLSGPHIDGGQLLRGPAVPARHLLQRAVAVERQRVPSAGEGIRSGGEPVRTARLRRVADLQVSAAATNRARFGHTDARRSAVSQLWISTCVSKSITLQRAKFLSVDCST